jgi:uncharacterized protein YoxC
MLAFSAGDLAYVALSIFLILAAFGVAFVSLRLGETLKSLSSFIRGAQDEVLPVVAKTGVTIDHVNAQMEKVDTMTDSAVDAVAGVDQTVRTVNHAVTTPIRKLSSLAAAISHGFADLRANRSWAHAKSTAAAAAQEREEEFDEELREAGGGQWPTS